LALAAPVENVKPATVIAAAPAKSFQLFAMRMSCPSYLHFAINAHSEVQFLEFRRLGRMMALLQIEL
jgi:hypothetical protein